MLTMLARCILVSAVLSGCAFVDRDPLGIGGDFGSTTLATVDVGQQVAFGALSMTNGSDDRFVLTSAELVSSGVAGGVHLQAAYAIDSLDVNGVLGAGTWPDDAGYPDAVLHPVAGYSIRPNATVHLLFVLDVRQPGRWEYGAVDVEYVGSGGLYSATAINRWVICADLEADCRSLAR